MSRLISLMNWHMIVAILLFFTTQSASAQRSGTDNGRFILRIIIDQVPYDYRKGDCGFGTTSFGAEIKDDICGRVQWARDIIGNDSLVCDSIPAGSLTGKIAIVRRGLCDDPNSEAANFSAKVLNAQKAGAIAVLVGNNSRNPAQNDCYTQSMGVGNPITASKVKIPALFLCREISTKIDQALKNGKTVEVCILPVNIALLSAYFPLQSVQTPISQIAKDTMHFRAYLINQKDQVLKGVSLCVKVMNAEDKLYYTDTLKIGSMKINQSGLFELEGIYVPNLPIGDYKVAYFTKVDSVLGLNIEDEYKFDFRVTNGLWAKDGKPGSDSYSPRPTVGDLAIANYYKMIGGSKERFKIKTVEFAHFTDSSDIPVNQVMAVITIFKVNNDVLDDFSNFEKSAYESPSLTKLGMGIYVAKPSAQNNQIQQVELVDINMDSSGIEVFDGERYFVSMHYSGLNRLVYHTFSTDNHMYNVNDDNYSTIIFNGDHWFIDPNGELNAVLRVYLDLVSITDEKHLPGSSMKILPNPTQDMLNLELTFDEPTDVTVTVAELGGRVISTEGHPKVLSEALTYQLHGMKSGAYLARIATKDGTLTKKFIIQK